MQPRDAQFGSIGDLFPAPHHTNTTQIHTWHVDTALLPIIDDLKFQLEMAMRNRDVDAYERAKEQLTRLPGHPRCRPEDAILILPKPPTILTAVPGSKLPTVPASQPGGKGGIVLP